MRSKSQIVEELPAGDMAGPPARPRPSAWLLPDPSSIPDAGRASKQGCAGRDTSRVADAAAQPCSGFAGEQTSRGLLGGAAELQATLERKALELWGGVDAARRAEDASQLQRQIERLMPELRIAVIFGGSKEDPDSVIYRSHNARSWKSYEAVAQDIADSLRRTGFRHVELFADDMRLGENLRRAGVHMAWLNSGGVQGYNSAAHAASMLEMLGVPYVGHDPLTATTLDNKHAFKREALCAGLPAAPFSTWNMLRGPFRPEASGSFQRAFGAYPGPFVVKPVSGRASLNVHVVEDRSALAEVIAAVYRETENTVLIEKYLSGREFCIAAAGPVVARGRRLSRGSGPLTFAALERVLSPEEKIFTSMDVRPITGDRFRSLDARDAPYLNRIHQLARDTFVELGLGSIIRLDIRSDEDGRLYVLEANPKPDLKRPVKGVTSLISAGLPEAGMDYDDLILTLLADRLDVLLRHRRGAVRHIVDLIA